MATKNNVKRPYVSHENDNLPAIIAEYAMGRRILYVEEIEDGHNRRFGVPIRNDLIFVHEVQAKEADSSA